MQLLWGARAARFSGPLLCCSDFSTAVFGVSPKTLTSFGPAPNGVGRIIVRLAGGKSEQIVGRTLARGPTRATGTVALPDSSESFRLRACLRIQISFGERTRPRVQ